MRASATTEPAYGRGVRAGPARRRVMQGDWKVSGFGFCTIGRFENEKQVAFNYADFDPSFPAFAQPALDFLGTSCRARTRRTVVEAGLSRTRRVR